MHDCAESHCDYFLSDSDVYSQNLFVSMKKAIKIIA